MGDAVTPRRRPCSTQPGDAGRRARRHARTHGTPKDERRGHPYPLLTWSSVPTAAQRLGHECILFSLIDVIPAYQLPPRTRPAPWTCPPLTCRPISFEREPGATQFTVIGLIRNHLLRIGAGAGHGTAASRLSSGRGPPATSGSPVNWRPPGVRERSGHLRDPLDEFSRSSHRTSEVHLKVVSSHRELQVSWLKRHVDLCVG